jgi:hypothetical protein
VQVLQWDFCFFHALKLKVDNRSFKTES